MGLCVKVAEIKTTDLCFDCGHPRYWHSMESCTISTGCECKEFVDRGGELFRRKTLYKPTNKNVKFCEDCGHRRDSHDKNGCLQNLNKFTKCGCKNSFELSLEDSKKSIQKIE